MRERAIIPPPSSPVLRPVARGRVVGAALMAALMMTTLTVPAEAGFFHALGRLFGLGSSHQPAHMAPKQPSIKPSSPPVLPSTPSVSDLQPEWRPSPLQSGLIRVGISDDAMAALEYPATIVGATGPFTVIDLATRQPVFSGYAGERVRVSVDSDAFNLTVEGRPDVLRVLGPLSVQPASSQSAVQVLNITRKGVIPQYRGTLEMIRGKNSPDSKLTVVNSLSLEDYLRAVVPNEMPVSFGLEALKAQAVAARNYAIRPRENSTPQRYDICDSQVCQVYFGQQTEQDLANRAIDATAGLVALYNDEPIVAMFSSTHGGYSEDYGHAFLDNKPYPYLKGKPDQPEGLQQLLATMPNSLTASSASSGGWTDWLKDRFNGSSTPLLSSTWPSLQQEDAARLFWTTPNAPGFDVDSPLNRWERVWRREDLEVSLSKTLSEVSRQGSTAVEPAYPSGQPLGTLEQIIVPERGVSGKAKVVLIVSNRGQWRVAKENVIRRVFAHQGKMLPSANIVFSSLNRPIDNGFGKPPSLVMESVKIQGGGFGHGVGMSQYGAGYLARKAGVPFTRILQHYYDGVSIGSIPLKVGGNLIQPASTVFRSPASVAQARLCVQAIDADQNRRDPVLVSLNGETRYVVLDGTGQAKIPVASFLKSPESANSMTLFPDANAPNRRLKAWVELVPSLTDPGAGSWAGVATRP